MVAELLGLSVRCLGLKPQELAEYGEDQIYSSIPPNISIHRKPSKGFEGYGVGLRVDLDGNPESRI